ncbi:hypothetical protein A2U01_0052935 [Trifolium medium]|uniref:Uncharacterized protein n=1 Tax=Trifolium medium TaxID=97028 RepID=A0A392R568_9FABA|nr:hypothetical protein [Trifolium medium]
MQRSKKNENRTHRKLKDLRVPKTTRTYRRKRDLTSARDGGNAMPLPRPHHQTVWLHRGGKTLVEGGGRRRICLFS